MAIATGLTPTAVLLNDPSRTEWTPLDIKLAKAYELRQTYGQFPPWIDQADRVSFDVKTFTSKSAAAVERKQYQEEKRQSPGATPKFGRRYVPVPVTKDGGPMPTMAEYYEEVRRKEGLD